MRNVMGEILKFAENRGKDADILTSRLNQVFTPVAEMFGVPVDPQQPNQGAMPPQQPAQGAMPPQQTSAAGSFSGVAAAGPGWTDVIGPDGQVMRREGTRAWRNNNPGNIEYGDFATSRGAIGTDGRFAVFPSYEDGRAAKEALLFESPSYRDLTISSAINRYAPPSENDTRNYVGQVASALGVSPDTRLSDLSPQQRSTMLDAMQQVEGFRPGTQNGSPVDETYRNVADALDVTVSTSGTLDTNDRRNVESLLGEMLNDTVFDQEQADADAAQWRKADLWTAFGTGIGQVGRGDAVDFSDIRNRAERRRNQNIELRMERARRAAGAQLALDMGDESMASAIAGGAADTGTLFTKRQQDMVERRANEQITRQAAQAGYLADALQDSGLPASKIEAIRNGADPTTILRVAEMSKAAEAAATAQERIERQMDLVENLQEQSMAARDATAAGQDAPQMDPILERALELAQLDGHSKILAGGSLYDYMSEARQQAGEMRQQEAAAQSGLDPQQVSNNLAAAQAILADPDMPDAARVAAQLVVDQGGALSPDEAADQITAGGAYAPRDGVGGAGEVAAARIVLADPNATPIQRDAAGIVLDTSGATSMTDAVAALTAGQAPEDNARAQRVRTLTAAFEEQNLPPERAEELAQGIVDGRFTEITDPETGALTVYDRTTIMAGGSPKNAQVFPPVSEPRAYRPPSILATDIDYENAFGPQGVVRNTLNNIGEAIGYGLVDPDNREAVQTIRRLATEGRIASAIEVGGRPSVYSLEMFKDLETEPAQLFTGPETARVRLENQRAAVVRDLEMLDELLAPESRVSAKMRNEAYSRRLSLLPILSDLDVVLNGVSRASGQEAASSDPVRPTSTTSSDGRSVDELLELYGGD